MREFLESVLGSYVPVTYDVYDAATDTTNTVVAAGLAGVDWSFVFSGIAFLIVIFCVFKALGAIVCKIS